MDRYDWAVQHLQRIDDDEFQHAVQAAWDEPHDWDGGSLFLGTAAGGDVWAPRPCDGKPCGCLTQVKLGHQQRMNGELSPLVAWTDELTAAIQADERLPNHPSRVTKESLPVFAEWQRRLDYELSRHVRCNDDYALRESLGNNSISL